jgi:hypothetical protein
MVGGYALLYANVGGILDGYLVALKKVPWDNLLEK